MSTSDGRPTNALFGFTSMLFSIIEKQNPVSIVIALDAPGKTFRHTEFAEYKGTRKETAPELIVQLDGARHLIASLGLPTFELTGYEADDIVGTISRQAEEHGYCTTVVTGDLDALQLVDDYVCVLTPKMGMTDTMTYDRQAVIDRYGFGPEYVPDFKALKGDTSDNIPGVPGIGDKGAAELINAFGTIETMIEKFAELPAKYQKRIDGNQPQMVKSKWLATIDRNVPVAFDFKPLSLTPQQFAEAKDFLEKFEFRQHVRNFARVLGPYLEGSELAIDAPRATIEHEKLNFTQKEVSSYMILQSAVAHKPYGIYFAAAKSADDLFDEPVKSAFIAVESEVFVTSEENGLRLLRTQPEGAITHDSKSLYRKVGETSVPFRFDSLLAGYVLQSGRANYALSDLVQGYTDFAGSDDPATLAASLLPLERAMCERLEKEGQTKVLFEVEIPLAPVLARMESIGIATNRQQLKEFSKQLEIAIEQSTTKIYEMAGQSFTIGSPKQLGEILFEKLGIPGAQKTKTGYATGAEILVQIAPSYEIAGEVLNWRELSKLKSTYTDALERLIAPDGRIHTTYNQTVAATGRLSSNDPNLQNIPVRTELGRGIRRAFEASEGFSLASFDYSQIELRVLADMCKEPALKTAFETHQDVHSATAKIMFHLDKDEPTKEQRRLAKLLNYAVLYGVTDFGLANQLGAGFSRSDAKELISLYNERFPTVKEFTKEVIVEARSKGYTTTLLGRRRYFPDIHASRIQDRQYAERQAMNAPIQGTAADMIKVAMLNVKDLLKGTQTRMLLNVHDELVFELKDEEHDLVAPIRNLMETALPLSVPIEVDAKIGPDWNTMTEVQRVN